MLMRIPKLDAHTRLNEERCNSNALSLEVQVDGIKSAMKRSVSVLTTIFLRFLLFSCTVLHLTRLYDCLTISEKISLNNNFALRAGNITSTRSTAVFITDCFLFCEIIYF